MAASVASGDAEGTGNVPVAGGVVAQQSMWAGDVEMAADQRNDEVEQLKGVTRAAVEVAEKQLAKLKEACAKSAKEQREAARRKNKGNRSAQEVLRKEGGSEAIPEWAKKGREESSLWMSESDQSSGRTRRAHGTDKDYPWESFVESFSLKYPRHSWSDKELKALLKSKLGGKAKAQYEALPREVRHGSVEGIMEALARLNREETQTKKGDCAGEAKATEEARNTDGRGISGFDLENVDQVARALKQQENINNIIIYPNTYESFYTKS
ncbi:hypothetical protein OSTOST_07763 [Ostertagia ostertagi]